MLQELSTRTAKELGKIQNDDKIEFDPATILLLIELIMGIIQAIQKCRNPQPIPTLAANPGIVGRYRLRRILKNKLGVALFYEDGSDMEKALLETGKNLTEQEEEDLKKDVQSRSEIR